MRRIYFALLGILLIFMNVTGIAQKPSYKDECMLIHDFLDWANKDFDFKSLVVDSTITIYDINRVLTRCKIHSVGHVKFIVINTGNEIDWIKKHSFLSYNSTRKDLFIFTKEKLNSIIGFRFYQPRSGGSNYWGFTKNKFYYQFKKKQSGSF